MDFMKCNDENRQFQFRNNHKTMNPKFTIVNVIKFEYAILKP